MSEQQRHQLFAWFEEHMGQERASTMMELMPPVGAGELATKQDLIALEQRLGARMDAKLAVLRSDLQDTLGNVQRTLGTWIVASQAAVITAIGVFTALG